MGVIILISLAAASVLNPARTAEKTPQYVCCNENELYTYKVVNRGISVLFLPLLTE